jgi:uncharacterized protein (DUF2141 family)
LKNDVKQENHSHPHKFGTIFIRIFTKIQLMRGILLILILFSFETYAQTLSITLENVEEKEGFYYVAVFASQEAFEKQEMVAKKRVPVAEIQKPIIFPNLKKGTYCVSVFYDTNDNKKLDSKENGIPIEPYGFSNNPGLGAPTFEKMCFKLEKDVILSIRLRRIKSK